jgi:hypothetical protein
MSFPRILKWLLWSFTVIVCLLVVAVLLLVFVLSHSDFGVPSRDEVARVASPNGQFDAILLETNGGATTSFGYEVYVSEHGEQPSGKPPLFLYGAIRNHNAYGANLQWESDNLLVIEYFKAKSSKINTPKLTIGGQNIQFAVREGVLDSYALPGGMLYNLRGRN